jgi:hypothetical protein
VSRRVLGNQLHGRRRPSRLTAGLDFTWAFQSSMPASTESDDRSESATNGAHARFMIAGQSMRHVARS